MATKAWFQYSVYMNNKLASMQENVDPAYTMPKLVAAFEAAGFSGETGAYRHFCKYGHTEDISPNALFDAEYYYTAKTYKFYEAQGVSETEITANLDLYVSNIKAAFAKAGLDAWTHYIKYGTAEGINPSASFNTGAYMSMKLAALQAAEPSAGWTEENLFEAFQKANVNALEHAILYGTDSENTKVGECVFWQDSAHTVLVEEVAHTDDPIPNPEDDHEGQTFVLTSHTDILEGTVKDDVFIADNSANNQTLTEADQIDGGKGTDTLKVFHTPNANLGDMAFGQLKNVEGVEVSKGALVDGAVLDTSELDGVTEIKFVKPTVTAGEFTFKAASEQTLHFSKMQSEAGVEIVNLQGVKALVLDDVATPTFNLASAEKALSVTADGDAKFALTNSAERLATLTLDGEGNLEVSAPISTLVNVDASAATGNISFDVSGADVDKAFSFEGGKGNDALHFADGSLARLNKGSQLNGGEGDDTLILDESEVLDSVEIGKVNTVTHFETLAFGKTDSGADLSAISSFSKFAVCKGNLTETFSNASSNDAFVIDNSEGNSGVVTISNAVGEQATSVEIVNNSSDAQTLNTLMLADIGTISLVSTGKAGNVISTFGNSSNASVTLKGNAALTIALTEAEGDEIGSKLDASAFKASLTAIGSGNNGMLIGGFGNDKLIARLNDASLTGNGGADTFDVHDALYTNGNYVTVTDFADGIDKIVLRGQGDESFTVNARSTSGAKTLARALDLIAGETDGSEDAKVHWGQYDGNTYIVEILSNDSEGAVQDTDLVVKLSGLVDLSGLTIGEDLLFA